MAKLGGGWTIHSWPSFVSLWCYSYVVECICPSMLLQMNDWMSSCLGVSPCCNEGGNSRTVLKFEEVYCEMQHPVHN